MKNTVSQSNILNDKFKNELMDEKDSKDKNIKEVTKKLEKRHS